MNLNLGSLATTLAQITGIAASIAAIICLLKVVGVHLPSVPGSETAWMYVAVACAAAKVAR